MMLCTTLPSEMLALLKDVRQGLFNERERRIKPGRDEKILTNWNGLMMRGFAEAGVTLGRRDYVEAAARCARFLYDNLSDIAIIGPPSDPRTEDLVGEVFERHRPNHVLVGSDPAEVSLPGTVALLQDRNMSDGLPAAFVCEEFTCRNPVTSAAALRSLL